MMKDHVSSCHRINDLRKYGISLKTVDGASKDMQRRGFAVAGPLAWNNLPVAARVSIARNSNSFKTLIKTHLFNSTMK